MLVAGVNYVPEPTGIAPYTAGMAEGLRSRGLVVEVLTAHPHYPQWRIAAGYGQWSRDELVDGVPVRRLRHYVPLKPRGVRRLVSEVSFGMRLCSRRLHSPSVVLAVSPALISSAMLLLRCRASPTRIPFVVWIQDLYGLGLAETGQGGGVAAKVITGIERWLLRSADQVIVIHNRFAARVTADFHLDPAKVSVVRNWSHVTQGDTNDRGALRARLAWGEETVVLHAGNMGVKQGLVTVVEAARLAQSGGHNVRFVLMGDGAERLRMEELGAGLGTLEIIDPVPESEFVSMLGAADVLLVNELPGVAEMAVPSKLTSYFAAGRPVLAATDEDGITAEEIRAAGAGVVVPAGDAAAILGAVSRLESDRELSAELGENGLKYRERVLSADAAIDAIEQVLAELASDRESRIERKGHKQ